jgi:hypothetical protein
MVLCPGRNKSHAEGSENIKSHVIMKIIIISTRLYGVMPQKEDISCNHEDYHNIYQTIWCYAPEGRHLM